MMVLLFIICTIVAGYAWFNDTLPEYESADMLLGSMALFIIGCPICLILDGIFKAILGL